MNLCLQIVVEIDQDKEHEDLPAYAKNAHHYYSGVFTGSFKLADNHCDGWKVQRRSLMRCRNCRLRNRQAVQLSPPIGLLWQLVQSQIQIQHIDARLA